MARSAGRWSVYTASAAVLSLVLATLVLVSCSGAPAPANLAEAPGTVELNKAPSNDVPMGGGGSGTVFFRGRLHRFAISGVGFDGSAVAIIRTSGEVYRLKDIMSLPGTYRRTSAPAQAGDGLWLQNEHATLMHLNVPSGGRMPDVGDDGLRVVLDE